MQYTKFFSQSKPKLLVVSPQCNDPAHLTPYDESSKRLNLITLKFFLDETIRGFSFSALLHSFYLRAGSLHHDLPGQFSPCRKDHDHASCPSQSAHKFRYAPVSTR